MLKIYIRLLNSLYLNNPVNYIVSSENKILSFGRLLLIIGIGIDLLPEWQLESPLQYFYDKE